MIIHDGEAIEVSTPSGPMRTHLFVPAGPGRHPAAIFYSEIFQVTPPIRRLAARLAGNGYVVAVPEVYHDYEAPGVVLGYDDAGKNRGNQLKYEKTVRAFDDDAAALIDRLIADPRTTGDVFAMGVCLGGHLALRAALSPKVRATAAVYPTDVHSCTLGRGKADDTLARFGDIRGEVGFFFGRQDPHVPFAGREAIRARAEQSGLAYVYHEFNAAHAFMRDEGERYDAAATDRVFLLALDLFQRNRGAARS